MAEKAGLVEKVEPGSVAATKGIKPGERLIGIEGQPVRDLLDYYLASADPDLVLEIAGPKGVRRVKIHKDWDQDLGLVFSSDSFGGVRRCRNRCLFCFVDQLPPGMRPTLYLKDDDYCQSVFNGSYITLTNLSREDWRRIISLHLNPLYVSVHAADPVLRTRMLGNARAGDLREQLSRLSEAGIDLHCQIVLCRSLNDGFYLRETLQYLASLWPSVKSAAVVPAGLTRHRQGLFPLLPFDSAAARRVLNEVGQFQQECLRHWGTRLAYAADEFYLLAGRPFPGYEDYEGFPQLENGVGLTRLFLDEWREELLRLPFRAGTSRLVVTVTGRAAARTLAVMKHQLSRYWPGARMEVLPLENHFFGPGVTVAGLLTGDDLLKGLKPHLARLRREKARILLPQTMLRDGLLFLDDYTLDDLRRDLALSVKAVEPTAGAFLSQLEEELWANQ